MANAPNSFRDPYWSTLASAVSAKQKLPPGLLLGILTNGERSNADQVSEAGARTPFQVTPTTRNLVLKRDGIDAYLSPENAAEVAGIVLKDGLNWAKGRTDNPDTMAKLAAGYYHGGGDTTNWGPKTDAYIMRVGAGLPAARTEALDSDFARFMAANPAAPAGASTAAVPGPDGAAAAPPTNDALSRDFAKFMAEGGKQRRGNEAVPTDAEAAGQGYTPPAAAPAQPQPGVLDTIVGAGEAGLNALTGATAGYAGQLIGGGAQMARDIGGIARDGVNYQRPANQPSVEEAAAAGGHALTYQPRTASGQAQAAVVQTMAQNLLPLGPVAGELAPLARVAQPGVQALADAAGSGVSRVGDVLRRSEGPAAILPQVAGDAATDVAATANATSLVQTAKAAADGGKSAETALAQAAAPDPAILKSADRLGIGDYLQPDHVTTNEAFRQVAGMVKSNPQSALALAERERLGAVAERASGLIDELGGTNDLSALSDNVKARMQETHEALSATENGLYDKLRSEIPAKTEAPADSVLAFVKQRADDLGGVDNLTPLEKTIVSKLTPTGDSLDHLGPAARKQLADQGITGLKQPSYALLDDVRRDVGAAARGTGYFRDSDTGLAKKLYGELSKDQEAAVGKAGMADTFDAARKATATRKGLEDDLAALFGKSLDRSLVAGSDVGLPGAMRGLAAGDSSRLIRLLRAVPEDMRPNVVASGMATVFRKAATRGEMDFTGYAKWMDGLMRNRQAYAAVMSNLPLGARKQLMALYRVSKGISDSLGARTKTGLRSSMVDEMMGKDKLMSSLYSIAKRTAIAIPVEAATSAVGLHGAGITAALASALTRGKAKPMAAVDALLASPEFAHLTRSQAGTPARAAAVRAVAASPTLAKVFQKSGTPLSIGERERWLLQSLQGVNDPDQRHSSPTQKILH